MKSFKTLLAGLILAVVCSGGAAAWDNTSDYLKRVGVDIKPTTTSTYDLGSSTKRWDRLYVDQLYGPSGGGFSVDGNIYPTVDNVYDLGSSTLQWHDGYFGNDVAIGGALSVTGDTTLSGSLSAGSLSLATSGASTFSGGYVVIGNDTTTMSGQVNGIGDVFIQDTLEVDKILYVDGAVYVGSFTKTSVAMGTAGDLGVGGDLEVDGALYVDGFLYGNGSKLTGVNSISGLTAGRITRASSATAIVDSNIYDDGSLIGIGTIAPMYKLDVSTGAALINQGAIKAQTNFASSAPNVWLENKENDKKYDLRVTGSTSALGGSGNLVVYDDTAVATRLGIAADGSIYLGPWNQRTSTGAAAGSVYMAGDLEVDGTVYTPFKVSSNADNTGNYLLVDSTGNVGIGTTTVRQKLEVDGTLYVVGGGNTGLGTITPAALLDVGGFTLSNVLADSSQGVKGDIEVDGKIYTDGGIYNFNQAGFLGMVKLSGVCHSMYVSSADTVYGVTQTCP